MPQKWFPLLIMKFKSVYLTGFLIVILYTVLFVSSSWLVLLSVLELIMMLLLFVRLQPLSSDNLLLFRYFLLQTLASMCLVSFFIGMFSIYVAWVVLFFKLVMPPFHVWLMMSMKFGDRKTFYWVMVIMKLPVMIMFQVMLVFFLEGYSSLMILMAWSGLMSLFLLWSSGNFLYFLMSSSFLHTLWSILSLLISKMIFLSYYLFYAVVLYSVVTTMYGSFEFLLSNEWSWDIYFSLFIFSGAPPSFMFLMKWSLLLSLLSINIFMFFMFLLFSGISLYLYFRMLFNMALRGVESLQIFKKSKLSFLVGLNMYGMILWPMIIQLS